MADVADIFGQDILLDDELQAVVAANGELVLSDGPDTGVQDIKLRLFTPLGELFYDVGFGSLVHEWIKEENTLAARLGFEAEVKERLDEDPRVEIGSASCTVVAWDEKGLTAKAQWNFIGEDHPYNLVIEVDRRKREVVLKDVDPKSLPDA